MCIKEVVSSTPSSAPPCTCRSGPPRWYAAHSYNYLLYMSVYHRSS
jgi:hypothetical protein